MESNDMTMLKDVKKSDDWIIECFKTEGARLDHSISSFAHIDNFFDK